MTAGLITKYNKKFKVYFNGEYQFSSWCPEYHANAEFKKFGPLTATFLIHWLEYHVATPAYLKEHFPLEPNCDLERRP